MAMDAAVSKKATCNLMPSEIEPTLSYCTLFELLAKVPDGVKGVADFLVQCVSFFPSSGLVEIDDLFAQIGISNVFRFDVVE